MKRDPYAEARAIEDAEGIVLSHAHRMERELAPLAVLIGYERASADLRTVAMLFSSSEPGVSPIDLLGEGIASLRETIDPIALVAAHEAWVVVRPAGAGFEAPPSECADRAEVVIITKLTTSARLVTVYGICRTTDGRVERLEPHGSSTEVTGRIAELLPLDGDVN